MDLSPSKWFVACWMVDDKISMHKINFSSNCHLISLRAICDPWYQWAPDTLFDCLSGFYLSKAGFYIEMLLLNTSIKSNMIDPELNHPDPIVVRVLMCWEYQHSTSCLLLLAHMMNTSPESEWSDNSGIWLGFTSCYIEEIRMSQTRPQTSWGHYHYDIWSDNEVLPEVLP